MSGKQMLYSLLCKIKHVRTRSVVRAQFDPPGKIDLCDSSERRDKREGQKQMFPSRGAPQIACCSFILFTKLPLRLQ